ncbi:MAG: hypothetical protein AYL29_001360 [Candidatus Bathyarchaeota archaeon B24]|nr:MAG: hypothetical protein AYL29_001360 [Candidatus Bathyarchaeota archaeon B24]
MSEAERRRKGVFLVFCMFVGMGIGFILIEQLGGLGFVASMFIGMGVGFLLDALIAVEKRRIAVKIPIKAGGLVSMLIGALFIAGGGLAIAAPELLKRYAVQFVGLGMIAAGVYLMLFGYSYVKAKT